MSYAVTRRQKECYDAIKDYFARHGYSPSLDDLCKALNVSSKSTISGTLRLLEQRGMIRRHTRCARSIEIIEDREQAMEAVLLMFANWGCEKHASHRPGTCYEQGKTANAEYLADRACVPCTAHRVLTLGRID